MDKASRLERIGKALQSIEQALQQKDLSELPADALLKLQLKYEQQLKEEYSEPSRAELNAEEINIDEIIKALSTLYRKQERGEVSPAQAKTQLSTLTALLSAHTRKEADKWIAI